MEGVIIPWFQPLKPEERGLAIRIFDEIIIRFESVQPSDSPYKPITLINLMRDEVSEKDEFLNFFLAFIQQELLEEDEGAIGLDKILSYLTNFPDLSVVEKKALNESTV